MDDKDYNNDVNDNNEYILFEDSFKPITEGRTADCTDCGSDPSCSFDQGRISPSRTKDTPVGRKLALAAIDIADVISSAVFLMLVLFMFVFKYVTVVGDSMKPTLENKDKLIITSMFYTPQQGDIVVIDVPGEDEPLVKRIIATEGQTIDLESESWIIYIDGKPLDEDYQINRTNKPMFIGTQTFPYKVETGKVFVMGDNRNESKDSRSLGTVDSSRILGKVVFRLYPSDSIGKVK